VKSSVVWLLMIVGFACPLLSQVKAPKRSNAHRGSEDLEERYNDLRCALVLIQSGNRTGTGFFISADGIVVTASHVVGDRVIESLPSGQFKITLVSPPIVSIKTSTETFSTQMPTTLENNADQWSADLAVLRTGKHATCWLRTADAASSRSGEHVITMGFPGLAFGSLSIYTGIISAKLKSDFVLGFTTQGQPLKSMIDFVRVQMPISTGLSGAPVLNDKNEAIAVVTNAGGWTQDLELLTQLERMKEQAAAQQHPQQNQPQQRILDLASALGQLAGLIHDYASPGYGDAVPLSYLKKTESPPNQQPSSPAH
jgi:hypothetical protein